MSCKTLPILSAVLLLPPLLANAAPNPQVQPIEVIEKATPGRGIFRAASRDKPLVIRSEKEAAQHFERDELTSLTKQVDFDQQIVLVFAWRGSGQDKLTYSVLESYPEQVVFQYKPGRTRDLRPHVYVYALRSNVKWQTGAGGGKRPSPKVKEFVRVEVGGKLNAEIVAIGGETTGIAITANGITWELEFGKRADLRQLAEKLHGQQVVISGALNRKQGVEIKERWIVDVTSLKAASTGKSPGKPQAYLTDDGRLKHAIVLRDAQSGFAGESGHLWTIDTDGSWRRQPFLNKNVREADQKGQLNTGHLKELAGGLAKYDLLGLPARLGKLQGANPHVVSVTFGELSSTMTLQAGKPLFAPLGDMKSNDRFAHVVQLLLKAMMSK